MADEPTLRSLMKPRFRGTLMGAAIGDALGFPHEGSSPSFMMALGPEITARFERHRSGYYPAGQYSDDTQMSLALVESILDAHTVDGAAMARHFVPLWRENRIIGRSPTCTAAMNRLMSGEATWENCGAPEGFAGNGAAARAAPLGLWNYDQPERLLEDVEKATALTHHDRRAMAGSAAVAAAVAYNVTHRDVILGEFLDTIARATAHFSEEFAQLVAELPRYLSMKERDALEAFHEVGANSAPAPLAAAPTAVAAGHAALVPGADDDGLNAPVFPSVMEALYYFLRSPGDYGRTIGNCLRVGGDVDTRTSMAGAISGALNGVAALPQNLAADLFDSRGITDLADRLYQLKESQRSR